MSQPYNADLADRMSDMPPVLLHLITHEVNSFGRWDVLSYFLESGSEEGTLDQIAAAIGRETGAMFALLGELVSAGWLSRQVAESGETRYRISQAVDRRRQLEQLKAAMASRAFILKAIYHWSVGNRSRPAGK